MHPNARRKRHLPSFKQLPPFKQLPSQKIPTNSQPKPQSNSKQKIITQLSQTYSPSNQTTPQNNTFDPQQIGIDLKKQAIITQNIPIAKPVPTISKLYLCTNTILCVLYMAVLAVSSPIVIDKFNLEQSSIPVITLVCLTLIVYVVYELVTVRCQSVKAFAQKMVGIHEFQAFFYQMKTANTYFTLELMGDRAKWSQKDQTQQMVYEPKVRDQSGPFYPLPQVISYCNSSPPKPDYLSKYSQQSIPTSSQHLPATTPSHQQQPFITIVLAEYQKKYYFANDISKFTYLNAVKLFFNSNQHMFDHTKPIKGHKTMEFRVDEFQHKKAYLMLTFPKYHQSTQLKHSLSQTHNLNQNNHSISKLQNDSFVMINDPSSLVVLEDDEIKHNLQIQPEGLIYKHKPKVTFDQLSQQIIEQKQDPLSQTEQKPSIKLQSDEHYKREENKCVWVFLLTYWTFLVLGFGAFYEWLILKKYVKCIQVTITKEIHERVELTDNLPENLKQLKE